jgi:hypothetical protein
MTYGITMKMWGHSSSDDSSPDDVVQICSLFLVGVTHISLDDKPLEGGELVCGSRTSPVHLRPASEGASYACSDSWRT